MCGGVSGQSERQGRQQPQFGAPRLRFLIAHNVYYVKL